MIDFAQSLTAIALQPRQVVVVHQGGGFFSNTLWTIVGLLHLLLFIYALIDCLNKCKPEDRIVWILIIIFVPVIGPILYLALAPRGGGHQTSDDLRNRANNLKSRYQNPRKPSSRFPRR